MTEIKNPLHKSVFPLPRSQWIPDRNTKECMRCGTKFAGGVFKSGKHHCRKCGHVVCKKCCRKLRKQLVCTDCHHKYREYEAVFTETLVVPVGHKLLQSQNDAANDGDDDKNDNDRDDEDDDDDYDDDESEFSISGSRSHSLVLLGDDGSPGPRARVLSCSVTRKVPLITLNVEEESVTTPLPPQMPPPPLPTTSDDIDEHAVNRVVDNDLDTHPLRQPKTISFSADYVSKNLECDIMLRSSASNPSTTSYAPSLLQVHETGVLDEGAHLTSTSAAATPEPPERKQLEEEEEADEEDITKSSSSSSAKKKEKRKKKKKHARGAKVNMLQFNNIEINHNFIHYSVSTGGGNDGDCVQRLQTAIGILKLYIEQLSIYTLRMRQVVAVEEDTHNHALQQMQLQWSSEDVWNAVQQRQLDEERFMAELKQRDEERVQSAEQKSNEYAHESIEQMCNGMLMPTTTMTTTSKEAPSTTVHDDNDDNDNEDAKSVEQVTDADTTNTLPLTLSSADHVKANDDVNTDVAAPLTTPAPETGIDCNNEPVEAPPTTMVEESDANHAMQQPLSDHEQDGNDNDKDDKEDDQSMQIIGFQDIYESVVAYEYDIKSLCDLILQQLENNDVLHRQIDSSESMVSEFRHQLKSLQSEHEHAVVNLHRKEQKNHELCDVLAEYESIIQSQQQQMQSMEHHPHSQYHAPYMNGNMPSSPDTLQHELQQSEHELTSGARKQKAKYEQFISKHRGKDEEDDDEDEEDVDHDGDDGGVRNNSEQKDEEEEEARVTPPPSPPHASAIAQIDELKAQKILSILTFEKCQIFHDEIGALKKWVTFSKHKMRNLKTDFAENYQFLQAQMTQLNDIRDEFEFQKALLQQQQHQLRAYAQETVRTMNTQEHALEARSLEVERTGKRLDEHERELKRREQLLETEKREFDAMARKYHQRKIDDELRNAQSLNARVSDVERKEQAVLQKMEEIEVSKKYLHAQKELYRKERELVVQQQQQVFFNEKQLRKQKDLLSCDQSYVQQQYIDAKDKFENDRYSQLDKINKLELEHSASAIQNESLRKQLQAKQEHEQHLQDTIAQLKQQMLTQQHTMNTAQSTQFTQTQELENLKRELTIRQDKIAHYESEMQSNHEKLMQVMQQGNDKHAQLQQENQALQLQIAALTDELQLVQSRKKTTTTTTKKTKNKHASGASTTATGLSAKNRLKRSATAVSRNLTSVKSVSSSSSSSKAKLKTSKLKREKETQNNGVRQVKNKSRKSELDRDKARPKLKSKSKSVANSLI